jgi:hypothetical protein
MTPEQIRDELQDVLQAKGFALHSFDPRNAAAMGAWFVDFRSSTITVVAGQDRTGDAIHICVGKLIDPAQRKGRIGRQPLCRIRGFFEGDESNSIFEDTATQIEWLKQNLGRILEHTESNLSEFRDWVRADSRRVFQQDTMRNG